MGAFLWKPYKSATIKEGRTIETILEIKGLTKDFAGLRALHDVDIELQAGEIFGLIGPNGSGKTTLLNVITGFLPPTAGAVMHKGKSITGLAPELIATKQIIRTFQITSIFSNLTVEENIITGNHLRTNGSLFGSIFHTNAYRREEKKVRQKTVEILSLLGMEDKMHILSKELGLGEQRRIEIAIALAAEPELLLLDEPASGLNPTEAGDLVNLLQTIRKMGITLLVIEHNMKIIMSLCTQIAVLDHGVKIAEGGPEEIANNEKVISVYLGGKKVYVKG